LNKALVSEIKPEILYAGFWKRVAAHVLDTIILTLIAYLAGSVLTSFDATDSRIFGILTSLIIMLLYYTCFESSSKQGTLGKQAVKIIVADLNLKRVSFLKAVTRAFALLVPTALISISGVSSSGSMLGLLIWLFMVLAVAWTKKKQGLHDILAGCLVVNREAIAQLPKDLKEVEPISTSIVNSTDINEALNADEQEA